MYYQDKVTHISGKYLHPMSRKSKEKKKILAIPQGA
jgi:hypothetical protein